jgi:hypothetical protein
LLNQWKQTKLKGLENPSHMNEDDLNNVRRVLENPGTKKGISERQIE